MSIQTRAPSVTIISTGTTAPSVTLMWAETPFSVLLASSGCTSAAPPSPVLTFSQSVQLALQWVGVARRAAPQIKLVPLLRPIPSLRGLHPLHPIPAGFPSLLPGFYQPHPPQGPPRYPCSLCSHEVGKVSLKCSTCSKWVHFSCSSLNLANFCKICAAGSTMGWNCPACPNGNLASTTHRKRPPAPSLQFCPLPPPTCSDVMDSSLPLPSHPPLLNTYPLSAFTLPSTPPPPTSTQPINNSPPHPQQTPRPLKTLEFYNGRKAVFSPHVVLN